LYFGVALGVILVTMMDVVIIIVLNWIRLISQKSGRASEVKRIRLMNSAFHFLLWFCWIASVVGSELSTYPPFWCGVPFLACLSLFSPSF